MEHYDQEPVSIDELVAMADLLGVTETIASLSPGWELWCLLVAHGVPSTHEEAKANALRLARHLNENDDLAFTLDLDDVPQLVDLARKAANRDHLYDKLDVAREGQPPLTIASFAMSSLPELGMANEIRASLVIQFCCYSQEKTGTLELHRFALNGEDAMALANQLRNYVREARSL